MNDETISAFLDREVDEEARLKTSKDLDQNAGAVMRLRLFKVADDQLRRATPPTPAPIDHVLSQRILNAAPVRPEPIQFIRVMAPLAAACLLGVLLGDINAAAPAGFSLSDLSGDQRAVLDASPSGTTRATAGGKMTLVMTLRTSSGNYCRQFRLFDTRDATDAIACRGGATWRVVVAAAAPLANDDRYHLAAGGQETLDAALRVMGGATSVDEAEELSLLHNHWSAR